MLQVSGTSRYRLPDIVNRSIISLGVILAVTTVRWDGRLRALTRSSSAPAASIFTEGGAASVEAAAFVRNHIPPAICGAALGGIFCVCGSCLRGCCDGSSTFTFVLYSDLPFLIVFIKLISYCDDDDG